MRAAVATNTSIVPDSLRLFDTFNLVPRLVWYHLLMYTLAKETPTKNINLKELESRTFKSSWYKEDQSMQIPDPFTPAAITAGIITNIASTILLNRTQDLEGTLVGKVLKKARLIEPNFHERLHDTLIRALDLYFKKYPKYKLTGIEFFFRDPTTAQQIGTYILEGQLPKREQVQHNIDRYLGNDGITKALMHQRELEPERIIPDFFECYRQVLREQLSVPQMAILLEVLDQASALVAEIQFSEERMKNFITQSLESRVPKQRKIHGHRPKDYLPFLPNPLFQSRPGEFEKLETILFSREDQRPARLGLVGMLGMGGVGKTQLAVEFVYRYKNRFPGGVFWMTATGRSLYNWQYQLAELAARTDYLPPNDDISHPENEARRAYYLCRYLACHRDALLILDNVEDPNLITSVLPVFAGGELICTILYTSRITLVLPDGITHDVEKLPEEGALRLLLDKVRPLLLNEILVGSQHAEAKAAREICQAVGYLPLALVHLRGYLARDQQATVTRLLQVLKERGALEIAKRQYLDAAPLFATFQLSWEKIAEEEDGAHRLFKLASFFPEAIPIPLWLLGLAAGLGETCTVLEPLWEARQQLQEVSLLEVLSGDQVRLHPLVREFGQRLVAENSERGQALLEEAGERIVIEFENLNRLESRATREGYWGCLAQVRAALEYVELLKSEQAKRLNRVERLLDRESYVLGSEGWWPDVLPGLFYQQLYNRGIEEDQLLAGEETPEQWLRQLTPAKVEDQNGSEFLQDTLIL